MLQLPSDYGRWFLFFIFLHHKVPVMVWTSGRPLLRAALCVLSSRSSPSRATLNRISCPALSNLPPGSQFSEIHAQCSNKSWVVETEDKKKVFNDLQETPIRCLESSNQKYYSSRLVKIKQQDRLRRATLEIS